MINTLLVSLLLSVSSQDTLYFPATPTNYVTDVANVISSSTEDSLNTRILQLRSFTGVEIAVVTLPTIRGRAPVDIAVKIGRAWGVGAKADVGAFARNAGIVMLIVPKTPANGNRGECFVATGKGAEGWLTDIKAARLCEYAVPFFIDGNYAIGITSMVATTRDYALEAFSEFSKTPAQRAAEAQHAKDQREQIAAIFVYVLIVIAAIITIIVLTTKWFAKNRKIAQLQSDYDQLQDLHVKTIDGLNKKLDEFKYPKMTPDKFEKYYNAEHKKEQDRLRRIKEAEQARLEKERKEREYWASPEGQAELARRKKRQEEEEEERRRRRSYEDSYSSRSSGGSSSGGGFGGFGGGGGFSGGGGGRSF